MLSGEFTKGFQHELANRAFALRSTEGIAKRLHGDPRHAFWASYVKLERFNAPRYQQAATQWGLDAQPTLWTKARGAASGAAPKLLLTPFLKFAHPKTVEYLEDLRRLRAIGPPDGEAFLDYMVNQEALQVEMMQLALEKRYPEVARRVDEFLLKYRDQQTF
ncbi:hypothetical protein [Streptomyces rubiginosohelvolus]|uniref:hypothetical protein n=1 Tax=Streptomyces rubiginosohelvolus TaxID=67362 RepID=UPI003665A9E5